MASGCTPVAPDISSTYPGVLPSPRPFLVLNPSPSKAFSGAESSRFYRPELDALRFFAFLCVFIAHTLPRTNESLAAHQLSAWFGYAATAGVYGVDLFFCLSAYLITELLVREKEACGELNVRAFYLRRMLRIWPLYFAFLGFALLLAWFDPAQSFSPRYLLPFLFLMGNWAFVLFGMPHSVAGPLWSVSVEEQFYLLWPLVVRRASLQTIKRAAMGLIGAAYLGRFLLSLYFPNPDNWYSTISHLDAIGYGVLIAVALRHGAPRLQPLSRVALALAGATAWLVAARYQHCTNLSPGLAALGSVAILLATIGVPWRNKALLKLGMVSYGLYVFHAVPVLYVSSPMQRSVASFAVVWMARLVATIAIALVSYRWLETPFLRLKERFSLVLSRPV